MSATSFPLTLSSFSAHCGSSFTVSEMDGLRLVLSEAVPLDVQAPDARGFSLIFRAPPAPGLPQATYTLDHPVLGSLAIFIVPVGRGTHGMQYQAIFN